VRMSLCRVRGEPRKNGVGMFTKCGDRIHAHSTFSGPRWQHRRHRASRRIDLDHVLTRQQLRMPPDIVERPRLAERNARGVQSLNKLGQR